MAHSFAKVWIHGVFGTKNRMPLILTKFEQKLHDHIWKYLEIDMKCPVRAINGTSDHIHMLFVLSRERSIAEVFKGVKGESSHWVNQQEFTNQKFAWQVGYGAFSVSETAIERVVNYIDDQKEHHKSRTFTQEYDQFLSDYDNETVETVSE